LPTGGRAYLDLGYRRQQVGIELDGRDVHAMPRALYNDRVRQNALTSLGWTILRFTWTDVTRGRDSFVATVAAALRR
jgi:very-short-patch-repair endonuclease